MFQKQPIMRKVLYSLIPIFLFSIYLYGLRVLFVSAVVFGLGILCEYLFVRNTKKKVSEAVLVTCALYTLAMPPAVPLWIAGVGIVFAVVIGKMAYGGFGRNIFNPAITGRLFIYIAFASVLGGTWRTAGNFGIDAVSSATPLGMLRAGQTPELLDMFLGFRSGAIGESSILLLLAAAIYLIITKTANWKIMLSTYGTAGILHAVLYFAGVNGAIPPHYALMSGSLAFITVFMVTDPVSAPKRPQAQWLYGLVIGVSVVLIRTFSLFPEGTSFAILMGNTFASLFDEAFLPKKKKKGAEA